MGLLIDWSRCRGIRSIDISVVAKINFYMPNWPPASLPVLPNRKISSHYSFQQFCGVIYEAHYVANSKSGVPLLYVMLPLEKVKNENYEP